MFDLLPPELRAEINSMPVYVDQIIERCLDNHLAGVSAQDLIERTRIVVRELKRRGAI